MINMNGAPTIEQYNGQAINPEAGVSLVAENQIPQPEIDSKGGNLDAGFVVETKQIANDGIEQGNKQVTEISQIAEIKPVIGFPFSKNSLTEIAVNDKANNVPLSSTAA